MSRRRDTICVSRLWTTTCALLALACLTHSAMAFPQSPAGPDYVLEQYLADHGLTELLAQQLADRMGTTSGAERSEIIQRLAQTLSQLIGSATDTASRAAWEAQAQHLLSAAPEAESLSLRMNLERARYIQAELTAERARVKLVEEEEAASASAVFKRVAPIFEHIALQSHQDILSLQKQEESANQRNMDLLEGALRTSRQLRSLGMYLAGWSNTYQAEILNAPARARKALVQFGWLLNAETNTTPDVNHVPASMLRYEHVGRAAIGAAVCYGVLGNVEQADAWLSLVEKNEATPRTVLEQIPPRRVTILARLGEWKRLARYLSSLRKERADTFQNTNDLDNPDQNHSLLPASLARLVVVLTLQANDTKSMKLRHEMARDAFGELVLRQDVAQVVDLVTRYGTETLGADGFIATHVRGVLAYKNARAAHESITEDDDSPTSDPAVIESYRRAATLLRAALRTDDADKFGPTRATTAMLLGQCLYYASGDAGTGLEEAIEVLTKSARWATDSHRGADAIWMAHRAALRFDQTHTTHHAAELAKLFNDRFPGDPRADVLRVELAASGELASEDAVVILLDTPRQSPAWEAARRRASRLLYEMYRSAPADQRDWSARRYADVAEPLLMIDRARALEGDKPSLALAIVRARRLLDAILSVQAPDTVRAQSVLKALQAMTSLVDADTKAPVVEVLFRTLQIALLQGDEIQAASLVDAIRSEGSGGSEDRDRYVRFADHAYFTFVANRWRTASDAGGDPAKWVDLSRAVVSRGAQLLKDYGDMEEQLSESSQLNVHFQIAHASFDLWRATDDSNALDVSYREHQLILSAQPGEHGSLRRLADLAEARGDMNTAMNCWRNLSAGLPPNTGPWFEARVRLIELIADSDPLRAKQALQQHLALRRDFGPEPWGSRLRALAKKLGVDPPLPSNLDQPK